MNLNPVANENFFVRVIEHSRMSGYCDAVTIHARYPRMIHSEIMTYRVFGRNARSSRAVPVWKLLREPIVEPLFYGSNKPGMQAGDELMGWRRFVARLTWLAMARANKAGVRILHGVGLHKQWANRPLEWFGSIDVQITSVQWANFFALRIDPAAQPEAFWLAFLIKKAIDASTPRVLEPGEWHLPWVTEEERNTLPLRTLKELSVARSARISYAPFDGNPSPVAETTRYRKLLGQFPVHASPAEHQLSPDWSRRSMHGNTPGWVQHRFEVKGHVVMDVPHHAL